MNPSAPPAGTEQAAGRPWYRSDPVRLIAIPLVIFAAWFMEMYLLAGNTALFSHNNPGELVLYTVVSCIIIGILVPILVIRQSFLSGSVNMFQIGFRSLRRTLSTGILTATILYAGLVLFSPYGTRLAGFNAFLLLLPTAIASVMICWVLAGTHIQAFFRSGGMAASILYGIIVTAILFDIVSFALRGLTGSKTGAADFFIIGVVVAMFFFAVRDIYAAGILLAACMAYSLHDIIDPLYLQADAYTVYFTALLAVVMLILVHGYFSRHYTTIRLS